MSSSTGINPFPGIRPFDVQEKYLFFGREDQTAELLTRLRKTRFLAVVGSSGSGKSSLVRAGLIPELHGGTMAAAGSSWEVAVMKPGGDPLTNLAKSLVESDLYDPDQEDVIPMIRAALSRSGMGLVDAVQQSDLEPKTNLLLVVDQFEEIFRFRRMTGISEEEAGHFIRLLLEASEQQSCPIYVVLTMRSDFLGDCAQFGGLAEAVNEGEYIIPRLNRSQRKQAIEAPARVGGREMSNRLVQRLLNDISDDPDQLPILQHALMRTWDYWVDAGSEGPVDLEHYQATGGMAEALSRHADEVFESLPEKEHRRIATKLFKSLTEKVSENRGIRRPMQLNELHEICGGDMAHLLYVINEFRKTGCTFLMPAGESELQKHTIIDISHESLMRVWRTLRLWVDDEAQSAKIYRRLADTASLFKDGKAGLYRDPDLGIALAWRDANQPNQTWADRYYPGFAEAMAFLRKSQKEEEREAREKEENRKRELAQAQALAKAKERSATIFKFACLGVSILAALAVYSMVQATNSKNNATKAIKSLALRSEKASDYELQNKETGKAAVWGADALELTQLDSKSYLTRQTKVINSLLESPKVIKHNTVNDEIIKSSQDTNSVSLITANGKLITLNYDLDKITETSLPFSQDELIAISKHNKLAAVFKDKKLIIHNIKKKEVVFEKKLFKETLDLFIKPKFSKSENIFVYLTRSEKYSVNILSVRDGTISKITTDTGISDLYISQQDQVYAAYSNGKSSSLITKPLETGDYEITSIDNTRRLLSLKSKNNHIHALSRSEEGTLVYNEIINDHLVRTVPINKEGRVINYETTPNNQSVILHTAEGELSIFNLTLNETQGSLSSQSTREKIVKSEAPIKSFKVSKDSSHITTVNNNNLIEFWSIETAERLFASLDAGGDPQNILYGPEGLTAIIVNKSGLIRKLIFPKFTDSTKGYFDSYFQTLSAKIENPDYYNNYKIYFPELLRNTNKEYSGASLNGFQIAELAFFNEDNEKLRTSDVIIKSSNDDFIYGTSGSPGGEGPEMAIDSSTSTKYFNFKHDADSHLKISFPSKVKITRIDFTSANDALGRAPVAYKFYGSTGDEDYSLISEGPIENDLYRKEIRWLTQLVQKSSKNLQKPVPYLTGYSISDSGQTAGYNYTESEGLSEPWPLGNDITNTIQLNGMKFFRDGNYPAALFYLERMEKRGLLNGTLSSPQMLRLFGVCLTKSGDFEKAITYLEQAIAANQNDWESILDLALSYLALGNATGFNQAIETLIETDAIAENDALWSFGFRDILEAANFDLTQKGFAKLSRMIIKRYNAEKHLNKERGINFSKLSKSEDSTQDISTSPNSIAYLDHPDFNFDRGITIEFWAKLGNTFGWLINYGGEQWGKSMRDGFSVLQLNNGNLRFEIANSSTGEKLAIDNIVPREDWFHFAVTWNLTDSTFRAYINGKPCINSTSEYTVNFRNRVFYDSKDTQNIFLGPVVTPPDSRILLAHSAIQTNAKWNGSLSDIRIWDHKRSDQQISTHFSKNIQTNLPGLLAHWELNHIDGDSIKCKINPSYLSRVINPSWGLNDNQVTKNIHKHHLSFSRNITNTNQGKSAISAFAQDWAYAKFSEGEYEEALKSILFSKTGTSDLQAFKDRNFLRSFTFAQCSRIEAALRAIGETDIADYYLQHVLSTGSTKTFDLGALNRRSILENLILTRSKSVKDSSKD